MSAEGTIVPGELNIFFENVFYLRLLNFWLVKFFYILAFDRNREDQTMFQIFVFYRKISLASKMFHSLDPAYNPKSTLLHNSGPIYPPSDLPSIKLQFKGRKDLLNRKI